MKVVLGIKVLVSNLFWKDSVPNEAVERAFEKCTVVYSTLMVQLLEKVLLSPKFDRYLTEHTRKEFIRLFKEIGEHIEVTERVKVVADPQANVVLETAVNASVSHIVTGDKDLLKHDNFSSGIRVVSPAGFISFDDKQDKASPLDQIARVEHED